MITLRELTSNPARDIVEGRTKLPTVRTVPLREFRTPLAQPHVVNGEWKPADALAESRSAVTFGIKHGLANRGFIRPPVNGAVRERLPMPSSRSQKLTVRF